MPRVSRNSMNRRRKYTPYVAPPDAPPIADAMRNLFQKGDKLRVLDEVLEAKLREIERSLERNAIKRIARVRLPDGAELAWSMNKRGRWRLVIRDGDDIIEFREAEPEERFEAVTSGALAALMKEAMPPKFRERLRE